MNNMNTLRAVCLALLASFLAAGAATVYHVSDADGDDVNSGADWANALKTISNGVAKAVAGDLVLVTNGTYAIGKELVINKGIRVRGAGTGGPVIVDGQNAVRCFNITHADAVVEGLTITRGNAAPGNGGGVSIASGTLSACNIVSNYANSGGGIAEVGAANLASPTVIENCAIGFNIATNATEIGGGGGLFLQAWRTNVLIRGCVVHGNQATNQPADLSKFGGCGGGMFSWGRGTVRNCVFSNNTASCGGGGLYSRETLSVLDCGIIGNLSRRGNGGGLSLSAGVASNCTISGNIAYTNTAYASYGGAGVFLAAGQRLLDSRICNNTIVYGQGGGVTIAGGLVANCVITNNSALFSVGGGVSHSSNTRGTNLNCLVAHNRALRGGGVAGGDYGNSFNCTIVSNRVLPAGLGGGYYKYTDSAVRIARLENCIITHNEGPGLTCNYANHGLAKTVFLNCCTVPAFTGDATNMSFNTIFADPRFIAAAAGDWRLRGVSPCIDTGTNAVWMPGARDLDGRPRQDRSTGRVDMGAYEHTFQGSAFLVR